MNATDTTRPVFKVTETVATYMGARAKAVEIRHDNKRDGVRTVLMTWTDDATAENGSHPAGTTTRKVVTGHPGKGTFEIIEAETVVA